MPGEDGSVSEGQSQSRTPERRALVGAHEYDSKRRGEFNDNYREVLAAEPSAHDKFIIKDLDFTFKALKTPPHPNQVDKIMTQVKSHGYDKFGHYDEANTRLGGSEHMQLREQLWDIFHGNSFGEVRDPVEEDESLAGFRTEARKYQIAKVAALQTLKELPADVTKEERAAVEKWVAVKTQWLDTVMGSLGIERTAMAFKAIPPKVTNQFSKDVTEFIEYLHQNKDKVIVDYKTRLMTGKISNFMEVHFSWVKDFGPGILDLHRSDVQQQAAPYIELAQKWWEVVKVKPTIAVDLAQVSASDQLVGTENFRSTHSPEDQSLERRVQTNRVHKEWIEGMTKIAKTLGQTFSEIEKMDTRDPKTMEAIEEAWESQEFVTKASAEQRQAIRETFARLTTNALNIKLFSAYIDRDALLMKVPFQDLMVKTLYPNINFLGSVRVNATNPLAIELFPQSTTDFDSLQGEPTNAGGFLTRVGPIPVIVIHPISPVDIEHERGHAMYRNKALDFAQAEVPKTEPVPGQTVRRIEKLMERSVTERAQDEMLAYIVDGRPFPNIQAWMQSDMYDYIGKSRDMWGYGDAAYDPFIQDTRKNYMEFIEKSLATADVVRYEQGLSNRDLAVLLAMHPIRKWEQLVLPKDKNT